MPPKKRQHQQQITLSSTSESDAQPPSRSTRSKTAAADNKTNKTNNKDNNNNNNHNNNKKAKPNASSTATALVSLQPTGEEYCAIVAEANKTRPPSSSSSSANNSTWHIKQYFPIPGADNMGPDYDELATFVFEDDENDFEITGVDGLTIAEDLKEWGRVLRTYYNDLSIYIANYRKLFRAAMTCKTHADVAGGDFNWPYQPTETHNKIVQALRKWDELEGEYYCSYCDRFVPHHQHHEVTENHPHHALCWCKHCTFNYNRMRDAMRKALKDLSQCPLMRESYGSDEDEESEYSDDSE